MNLWTGGAALVLLVCVVSLWGFARAARARRSTRAPRGVVSSWLARRIERRFGGYVHALVAVNEDLPLTLAADRAHAPKVLVIGAGLAGMGAACDLAERGFAVTLLEQSSYLGGKVGAWRERSADGTELEVEHGFHAFFRHYYNLQTFLQRTGVSKNLVPVHDYLILEATGKAWSFRDVETTPVLNLIALMRRGLYRARDILLTRALHEMDVCLAYEREQVFSELDHVSYAQFAEHLQLPAKLRLVFNTFARSFFADAERLSAAELIKSFHFYYLSHDHGLLYDHPAGSYQTTVLDPLEAYLKQRDVRIVLGSPCDPVTPLPDGRTQVGAQRYDYVIIAASTKGAQAILQSSPALGQAAPILARQLSSLPRGQRYAVWHLWIDRDVRADVPVFISTERRYVLDAVALCHRIGGVDSQSKRSHGGFLLELHSYALPDDVTDPMLRAAFVRELLHYFPELDGFRIVHQVLQVRDDFSAFHVGTARSRPETRTELPRLFLAGDWVRLPCPAMLMEAAYTSALLAVNGVLDAEGLRPYPVLSVPLRGLLYEARRAKLRARAAASGVHREPKTQ
jgi:isorenieratene synthase